MDKLIIQPLGIKVPKFQVEAVLSLPVSSIFSFVVQHTGTSNFKLMYRGKTLSSDTSLKEQGVKPGSKIILMQEATSSNDLKGIDNSALEVLLSMGFEQSLAIQALTQVGPGYGNIERALAWIERNQSFILNAQTAAEQPKPLPQPTKKLQKPEQPQEEIAEILSDDSDLSGVFTWGSGNTGQLGLGNYLLNVNLPFNVRGLRNIQLSKISCGGYHTLALSEEGHLYFWGKYLKPTTPVKYGHKTAPSLIEEVVTEKFVDIAAGSGHNLALDMLGRVWAWGDGSSGQLGHSTTEHESYPKVIQKIEGVRVKSISAGGKHSACVAESGPVMTWGDNHAGQLGTSDKVSRLAPALVLGCPDLSTVECGIFHTVGIGESGVWRWGSGTQKPEYLELSECPRSISCGGNLTYILGKEETLFRVKEPEDTSPVQVAIEEIKGVESVECGGTFGLVLLKNGALLGKGENKQGQLGLGDYLSRDQWTPVKNLKGMKVVSFSSGVLHSAVITRIENLKTDLLSMAGSPEFSDLQIKCSDQRVVPVHSVLLKATHHPELDLPRDVSGSYVSTMPSKVILALLQFIYSGQAPLLGELDQTEATQLLEYSEQKEYHSLTEALRKRVSQIKTKLKFDQRHSKAIEEHILKKMLNEEQKPEESKIQEPERMQIESPEDSQEESLEEQESPEEPQESHEEKRRKMLEAFEKRMNGN